MPATNRLATELSPYLRQHASNPVDWYPWGEEPFAVARATQRPVLLSIGYAACHWCHVMAHESFEDPAIAALMNDAFVNIKVDREERPDVDAVYMSALQAMTGSGGWPLTAFLTPDAEPFYAGTYFPPVDRGGLPSFARVLGSVARAWGERREELRGSAARLGEYLKGLERTLGTDEGGAGLDQVLADAPDLVTEAVAALAAAEDDAGGFGGAPKFPPHAALRLLLSTRDPAATAMAERTLDAMAAGGIHDHLGGGFFRYGVDRHWRLPHFEKMLSDNAQLLLAYATAHAAYAPSSGGDRHRRVALRIVSWLERELATTATDHAVPGREAVSGRDEVAFFNAIDADSEGEEGRFYAWSETEFRAVVGAAWRPDADEAASPPDDPETWRSGPPAAGLAAEHYGVSAAGTFEGGNVLRVARPASELAREHALAVAVVEDVVARASRALHQHRDGRVRPATDDKVVTSMNGLLLSALSEAGRLLDDRRSVELALSLATFLRRHLWRDGRLLHVWREGEARVEGLLEDYAYLGLGLLSLYRTTFEPWALTWAFELADVCEARFADSHGGGYFSTAVDAAPLLVRPKGQTDGATPSESVAAAELVWWAARYRSEPAAAYRALRGLEGVRQGVASAPQAFASGVRLLAQAARPAREVVLVGAADSPGLAELVAAFRRHDDGTAVVVVVTGADHPLAGLPLLEGRVRRSDPTALAYVCRDGACDLPVSDASALSTLLGAR